MFITLEGPEGSGKTSQIPPLAEFLQQQGYSVLTTREPGGTAIGDQVRAVLTNLENTSMHPRTEILLFLAARAQLVEQCIRPALSQGSLVLCDRYADSTLAYQGYGHGTDLDTAAPAAEFCHRQSEARPDPAAGYRPRERPAAQAQRRRVEPPGRLRAGLPPAGLAGLPELARQDPQRWVIIDASQPFDVIQDQIRKLILDRLSGPYAPQDKNRT